MSGQLNRGTWKRGGRGRAARHATQPTSVAVAIRGRGPVPGVCPVLPDSTARTLEKLTLKADDDRGSCERRRESCPTENGNLLGVTSVQSVGLHGEGQGQRRELRFEDFDSEFIPTRRVESDDERKQGSVGQSINIFTNYFQVCQSKRWRLYQHRVYFSPEDNSVKTKLLRQLKTTIGSYVFDRTASHLYTLAPLCKEEEPREFRIRADTNGQDYVIRVHNNGKVQDDSKYICIYDLIFRECLETLQMTRLGQGYFDQTTTIALHGGRLERLEVWPGFKIWLRVYRRDFFMFVEMTHIVISQYDVLDFMDTKRHEIMDNGGSVNDVKLAIAKELLEAVVIIIHNKKIYRVCDILWYERPTNIFAAEDGDITYIDYYKKKYNIDIRSGQPLLAVKPRKRDIRRGRTTIKLVPELCRMIGLTLTDSMKEDVALMKHLLVFPDNLLKSSTKLIQRFRESAQINADLEGLGLSILPNPMSMSGTGRILPKEKIIFRGPKLIDTDDKGEWTTAFASSKMVSTVELKSWVVIVPEREFQNLDNLIDTIQRVGKPMGFEVQCPTETVKLGSVSPDDYSQAITGVMEKYAGNLQLLFIILPSDEPETYLACKIKCNVEYGILSQCFLAKNLRSAGLTSICTNVVIEMNAKLGGLPWDIEMNFKKLMIVAFDVCHGGVEGQSVGAMVCTTSYGRYYSTTFFYKAMKEVPMKIHFDLMKCLDAWALMNNGELPDRVIFYREGVGEEQLEQVDSVEPLAIRRCLKEMYYEVGRKVAKLTYVVVTRGVNMTLIAKNQGKFENPPPGTIVDAVLTYPDRWDFYLIADSARQGTVEPTYYNILWDRNNFESDEIQLLTYKLCHAYYNRSGTIAVPALCKYARKLAEMTGLTMKVESHPALSHLLYFL